MFTLLNWMSLSGLSCIIHAEPRNALLRLELLGLFYLSDRSVSLWVVVIPYGICATLLWNPAWLPLHSHSFLCILLRNSAGKAGRFLVNFLSFPYQHSDPASLVGRMERGNSGEIGIAALRKCRHSQGRMKSIWEEQPTTAQHTKNALMGTSATFGFGFS